MVTKLGLTKSEMREQIRRINRINLAKSDYKTISSIVRRMIVGVPIMVGLTNSHELFFRARRNPDHKLQHVSELCAPPIANVTGYQRCNAPGQPMFYCSSRRITALLECDVQPGDTVYLSQWIGREQVPINKVLSGEEEEVFSLQFDEKDYMFYSFLETLFTKRVAKDFSRDYMITAAISEVFTSEFKPEAERKILDDGRIGIRYPSVVDIENSYNIAFPPDYALKRLDLIHAMELKVVERNEEKIYVSVSDTATDFEADNINWTGDALNAPAPRDAKGGVFFRSEGGKWHVLTVKHLPTPLDDLQDYLNQLMAE